MADNGRSYSGFAIILGGVVFLALMFFLVTGGDIGGKKKVQSDADLPQVTSPAPRAPNTALPNTGTR